MCPMRKHALDRADMLLEYKSLVKRGLMTIVYNIRLCKHAELIRVKRILVDSGDVLSHRTQVSAQVTRLNLVQNLNVCS